MLGLLHSRLERSRDTRWPSPEAKSRQVARKLHGKPNLVCGPVHICWHKFARHFDVELRQIPCEGNRLMMSPEEVVKRCDENTIGVVPTLGLIFTLQYEPVQAIAFALDDLEEERASTSRSTSMRPVAAL